MGERKGLCKKDESVNLHKGVKEAVGVVVGRSSSGDDLRLGLRR